MQPGDAGLDQGSFGRHAELAQALQKAALWWPRGVDEVGVSVAAAPSMTRRCPELCTVRGYATPRCSYDGRSTTSGHAARWTLALEQAYRLGEPRVTPDIVATTMAPDLHALEATSARYGGPPHPPGRSPRVSPGPAPTEPGGRAAPPTPGGRHPPGRRPHPGQKRLDDGISLRWQVYGPPHPRARHQP
jgi:hypothetical protein